MTTLHSQQPGLPPDEHKRHVDAILAAAQRKQERPPLGLLIGCAAVVVLALGLLAWCMYGPLWFTLVP